MVPYKHHEMPHMTRAVGSWIQHSHMAGGCNVQIWTRGNNVTVKSQPASLQPWLGPERSIMYIVRLLFFFQQRMRKELYLLSAWGCKKETTVWNRSEDTSSLHFLMWITVKWPAREFSFFNRPFILLQPHHTCPIVFSLGGWADHQRYAWTPV